MSTNQVHAKSAWISENVDKSTESNVSSPTFIFRVWLIDWLMFNANFQYFSYIVAFEFESNKIIL